jgi:hypothetical protein
MSDIELAKNIGFGIVAVGIGIAVTLGAYAQGHVLLSLV